MTGIEIREVGIGDSPALHALRRAAFEPVFAGFRAALGPSISAVALAKAEEEQAAHLDGLLIPSVDHGVLLACTDDKVLGFCGWRCDPATGLGEVDLNAVDPAAQGQGIGTALYQAALDQLRARGMKAACVGTGLDDAHAPARAAYTKAGFGPGLQSIWLYRTL